MANQGIHQTDERGRTSYFISRSAEKNEWVQIQFHNNGGYHLEVGLLELMCGTGMNKIGPWNEIGTYTLSNHVLTLHAKFIKERWRLDDEQDTLFIDHKFSIPEQRVRTLVIDSDTRQLIDHVKGRFFEYEETYSDFSLFDQPISMDLNKQ